MKTYRLKLQTTVHAYQWLGHGDIPADSPVTPYRNTHRALFPCDLCHAPLRDHGEFEPTLSLGWVASFFQPIFIQLVCPGNWVVEYEERKFCMLTQEEFAKRYE